MTTAQPSNPTSCPFTQATRTNVGTNATTHPEGPDQAVELTARPEPSIDMTTGRDGVGAGPQGLEEDESLRALYPKSTVRQFGQAVDTPREPDQEEGVHRWVEQSPGMRESFDRENSMQNQPTR